MREAVAELRTPVRPVVAGWSHGAQMTAIIAGCLAVASVTLLLPSTPTYDPWAWILWGREILHLDLVTEGGPSWKPFPIVFTTPFAVFGQNIAPYLWIWLARAGGLFGCVMAYRTAHRLIGGRVYGARSCPKSENGVVKKIGSGFHDGPPSVTRSRCAISRPQRIHAQGS